MKGDFLLNFIVDCTMPAEYTKKLSDFGSVFKSAKINIADKSVSTHPDMQIHFLSNNYAICAPCVYEYYKNILPSDILLEKGNSKIGYTYPENCAYNIAKVQKYVICNEKIADSKILEFYRMNSYKIIHVNQGYSKCNICSLSDKNFFTEDVGIYNATNEDLNPILLSVGGVALDGFNYGFIGGATGCFNDTIIFSGKIDLHPNASEIITVIKKLGLKYIELSDNTLRDFGSIISFG